MIAGYESAALVQAHLAALRAERPHLSARAKKKGAPVEAALVELDAEIERFEREDEAFKAAEAERLARVAEQAQAAANAAAALGR